MSDNLSSLADILKHDQKITEVSAFGLALHISALKGEDLTDIIQQNNQYQWREIVASLEDVFIHLMQQNQDNFA